MIQKEIRSEKIQIKAMKERLAPFAKVQLKEQQRLDNIRHQKNLDSKEDLATLR